MAETIYVYQGETFMLNVSFASDQEQLVILNSVRGGNLKYIDSDEHPNGDNYQITNANTTPLIFELFSYYKNARSGREPWRPHSAIIENKWDILRRRYYKTLRGNDGGNDQDYNDTILSLLWLNYNQRTRSEHIKQMGKAKNSKKPKVLKK